MLQALSAAFKSLFKTVQQKEAICLVAAIFSLPSRGRDKMAAAVFVTLKWDPMWLVWVRVCDNFEQ